MRQLNTILLVDDDPATNFYHTYILKEANIAQNIDEASNGKDALTYLCMAEKGNETELGHDQPSLIFLDLNMPVMNGFDFLDAFEEWQNAKKQEIKICILTSSEHENDKRRAANYSCISEYLSKPLSDEVLRQVMDKHFA
jgi:CheY-like chemotaxis protein